MKGKNKIVILSSISLLIIIGILFISYGFYHTKVEGNETGKKAMLSSQTISVEFSDGTESLTSSLNDEYFYPGSTLTKTFTIKNTGTVEAKYSINLSDIVNDFERVEDLTYELKSNDVVITSGIFPKTDIVIVKKETLAISEIKNYTLTIKYLESTENQIIDNGKIISGNIKIDQNVKYITDLKIYGNSKQGNNLLLYPYKNTTTTINGVTFTDNKDGTITVSGTATSEVNYYLFDKNAINLETNSNYYLTGCPEGGSSTTYELRVSDDKTTASIDYGAGRMFSYNDINLLYAYIRIRKDYTADNLVFKPMIVKGTEKVEYVSQVPTPENPIEVKSLGENSRNLFDPDIYSTSSGYYYDGSGSAGSNDSRFIKISPMSVKPNTTYSLSSNLKIYTIWFFNNETSIKKISFDSVGKSFTTPENCTNIRISIFNTSGLTDTSAFKWLQLEENSNATDYVPHKYIKLVNRGKNLWINNIENQTKNGIIVKKNSDGSLTFNGTATSETKFNFLENGFLKAGTYTMSGIGNNSNSQYATCMIGNSENTTATSYRTYTLTNDIELNNTNSYIQFNKGTVLENYTIYPQLEKGSKATEYEPYQEPKAAIIDLNKNEPLRCIGNVCDYIDYKNRNIKRYIGVINLNDLLPSKGSQYSNGNCRIQWGSSENFKPNYINAPLLEHFYSNTGDIIISPNNLTSSSSFSNYYLYLKSEDVGLEAVSATTSNVTIGTAIKNYLTPLNEKIYYVLETPIEESIDLPNIDAQPYTNNVEICDDIMCSSKIEADYD